MRRWVLVVGMCALLAAACGDDDGTATTGGDPWGRTFLTAGPPPVQVSFDAGSVSARAECNTFGGNATIEDGVLLVTDMGGTEMGCDEERHAYDEWLVAFLTSSPTITLDGATLTLTSGEDSLVLTDREIADPDRPLIATEWVVDGIVSGDAVSSVPQGVEASLHFTEHRVEGSVCNSFGAGVTIESGRIEVGGVTTTDMACEDDVMSVETAVFATLDGAVDYEIEAAILRLTGPDGHGLMLRAAE
jgi:heat shock protein HslJ